MSSWHRRVADGSAEMLLPKHSQYNPQGMADASYGVHKSGPSLVQGTQIQIGNNEFRVLFSIRYGTYMDSFNKIILSGLKIPHKEIILAQ